MTFSDFADQSSESAVDHAEELCKPSNEDFSERLLLRNALLGSSMDFMRRTLLIFTATAKSYTLNNLPNEAYADHSG